jgi:hypothetical protein
MLKSSSLCLNSSNLGNFWLKIDKLEKRGDENKKIFSSETTDPISTKLC